MFQFYPNLCFLFALFCIPALLPEQILKKHQVSYFGISHTVKQIRPSIIFGRLFLFGLRGTLVHKSRSQKMWGTP